MEELSEDGAVDVVVAEIEFGVVILDESGEDCACDVVGEDEVGEFGLCEVDFLVIGGGLVWEFDVVDDLALVGSFGWDGCVLAGA